VLGLDTDVKGVIRYRPVGSMPPSQACRRRLVQTALKLFGSRGYYNTSIADILRESSCTRGALYHHFSSKEELGYAAIDEAMRLYFQQGSASHLQGDEHPIDRLSKALEALPSVTELGAIGSSATDLTLRMATMHEGFRKQLGEGTGAMIEQAEEVVCRGVADGQIADSVDPLELAHVFVTVGAGMQFSRFLWEREAVWEDTRRWLKEYLNSLRR
jgi:TetR/AcrR family transcriptional repressor of nem operon